MSHDGELRDPLRVLLVEDNAAEAFLLRESIAAVPNPPEVLHVERLDKALDCLGRAPVDAVLLDLELPDSEGLGTLDRVCAAAGYVPIVVLTGREDEAFGLEAVRRGAQDYVPKGQAAARQLVQTLYHAVERKRYETALARSAQKNLLLAEVMAGVVAQTEVEDLLKTVAEAGRRLSSARICCSGAGRVDGQFRVNAIAHEGSHPGAHSECLNCGVCLKLLAQAEGTPASCSVLRGRTTWRNVDPVPGRESQYVGVPLIDSRGRMTGSIIIGDCESAGDFTPEDEYRIRQLAAITSLALQHIESRRAAESASVAKSRFLANMSHELRTPMNAILGMTDLALAERLDPKVRDCLETARESALSLLDLLNEILDLSRVEAGRFELESTPFNLEATVEQVVKTMRVQAREKGLALVYHLSPAVPERLVGDPLRLRQVLINLVDNAVKFTRRGRIVIEAGITERTPEALVLEFSVSDTGIGIPEEDRERIFSAFTQADASTTRNYGGSGLGLTISRRLVELMGGRLWVESAAGEGSTFHFTVRLQAPAGAAADAPLAPRPILAPAPGRILRVLLAEDTPTNQKLEAYVLEKRGHVVDIAPDGRRAVDMVRRNAYDVLLMDVQMPVMDGFQATAEIRALPDPDKAGLPIIAITAHTLKGDTERCLAAGMDAYIGKPIQAESLIDLVEFLGEPGASGGGHSRPTEEEIAPAGSAEGSLPRAAFDLEEAVGRCFGKFDFFLDMVDGFFEEADGMVRSMREALSAGKTDRVRDDAHRLKNTVIYLGAHPAAAAITAVEKAARAGQTGTLAAALAGLEAQLDQLKAALEKYRRTGAPPDRPEPCPGERP